MSESKRKNFTSGFKAKVALEAIRGVKTSNEIGQDFGVHPTQVGLWKKELQEQASSLFDAKRGPKPADPSASPERLYSEIGRLKMELDWLKKSLGYACHDSQVMDRDLRIVGGDSAMRAGRGQPHNGLCAAPGCRTGRAGTDVTVTDRHRVHAPPVLRQPQDDGVSMRPGTGDQPKAGAATHAYAGAGWNGTWA